MTSEPYEPSSALCGERDTRGKLLLAPEVVATAEDRLLTKFQQLQERTAEEGLLAYCSARTEVTLLVESREGGEGGEKSGRGRGGEEMRGWGAEGTRGWGAEGTRR